MTAVCAAMPLVVREVVMVCETETVLIGSRRLFPLLYCKVVVLVGCDRVARTP